MQGAGCSERSRMTILKLNGCCDGCKRSCWNATEASLKAVRRQTIGRQFGKLNSHILNIHVTVPKDIITVLYCDFNGLHTFFGTKSKIQMNKARQPKTNIIVRSVRVQFTLLYESTRVTTDYKSQLWLSVFQPK